MLGGTCFILPAALTTLAFALAYVRFGSLPQVSALLYGVKPIIIVIVVQALWGLGRTAVKSWMLAALAALAVAASFAGLNPLVVLVGAGLLAMAASVPARTSRQNLRGIFGPGIALFGQPLSFSSEASMLLVPDDAAVLGSATPLTRRILTGIPSATIQCSHASWVSRIFSRIPFTSTNTTVLSFHAT